MWLQLQRAGYEVLQKLCFKLKDSTDGGLGPEKLLVFKEAMEL
jgi:hypothetical protein